MGGTSLSAILIGFILLIVLMSLGLHVAFVMFFLSIAGALIYLGLPATFEYGTQFWGASNNSVLVSIPLFILLGEFLVRGGFTDRMYKSLSDWLSPLPGGLLHSNIGASALFAAVSGIVRRYGRHHRHGCAARFQIARLQRKTGARHHCRRRDAGHPDSAIDQHDHLRRHDQHLGRQAVRGRRGAWPVAHRAVYGHRGRRVPVEAEPCRIARAVNAIEGQAASPARSGPAGLGHPAGHGKHLRGLGDAYRIGSAGCRAVVPAVSCFMGGSTSRCCTSRSSRP